ncbi:MAG: hypothetical protein REI09_03665 [Candidatus Dactylopiibacterium sp.]|nr:hypothetical protein [Candidatus Dactylopiibacterium sp.]
MRRTLLRLALLTTLAPAAHAMPVLQALQGTDIPAQCGCRFGVKPGETLLFWSWEADKAFAWLREREAGVQRLRLYSEKYFPAQHEPPRAGDRMTLQFSQGNWSVQTANEVSRACAPRASRCAGTDFRSRIVLQWAGRERRELTGWARCGC